MFKKIVSIVIAVMMIASMAVVVASAADDGNSVGANSDGSAALAAGSGDDSVGAEDGSGAAGAGNSISFKPDTSLWKNFKTATCYIYEHGGDKLITWGSKKGNMTNNNGVWTFDLDKAGITIESGKQYGVIFTGDWNAQTCDLIMDSSCIGATASLTGDQVENNVDSNKKSYVVHWDGKDSKKLGPPVCITSIGNVIGEAYWDGDTPYKMLVQFIKSDGKDGLANAIKFNGKTEQQTLDDTANALGLGQDDIEKAIKEAGKEGQVKWTKAESKAAEGSSSNGGGSSSDGSSSDGSSGGSSSGGSSSGGSSSSGGASGGGASGGSGSSSVTSGQETTIFFVFGGVMLAAAGVIFLMRKRRDY